ncbi:MAG: hypothetical protein K0R12_1198 [Gammaproteobacteria bacterium]|nr:hypothetical protein [Gammaproteobacteria bacterium]
MSGQAVYAKQLEHYLRFCKNSYADRSPLYAFSYKVLTSLSKRVEFRYQEQRKLLYQESFI